MNALKLTIMGCGTSTGVPVIGCPCDICQSGDPRNNRTRTSALVSTDKGNILIDTAPDLRAQAMATRTHSIDAVIFTHDHSDHIAGVDELRTFNFVMGRAIPIYGNEKVIKRIKTVFEYIWDPDAPRGGGLPMLHTHTINGALDLCGVRVEPLPLWHGEQQILGFKFEQSLAYLTDCNKIPPETMEKVKGVRVAVIDGLRYRPHTTHLSVDQAVSALKEIGPQKGILTHLSHSLDYNRLRDELPEWIEPAYDGMIIDMGD